MTKAWLWNLRGRELEKRYVQERLKAVEEEVSLPKSPSLTGMPRSGDVGRAAEDAALRLAELGDIYYKILAKLASDEAKLEKALASLSPMERIIARERYISARNWDQIADTVGYSTRQTQRIHGALLQKLQSTEI